MDTDQLVLLAVIGLRLGIPLLIPRFPLPAIVASLVIDAADQTIFQNLTNLDLDGYQGYDKALDIYYLAVAYLSTLRNWTEPFAFRTAQFLWYYRLLGVMLFEATEARALLIIFPNTFEYFFIAYETVRLAWSPRRLGHRTIIGMVAFIWIVIKLPQEWWLHIAQLDFTDFMKEDVFGVTTDTSWGDAISQNMWFVALMAVLAIVVAIGIRAALRAAPPADWPFSFDVDAHPRDERANPIAPLVRIPLVGWFAFEKFVLITMILVIFSLVMPGSGETTLLGVAIPVAVLLVGSSMLRDRLVAGGRRWATPLGEFVVMAIVNVVLAGVFAVVLWRSDTTSTAGATLFFVLLLTLISTLFDRFSRRRAEGEPTAADPP